MASTRRSMLPFYSLILVICFKSVISSGVYADNNREQSVLYEPFSKTDEEDIKFELLSVLGLSHSPKKPRRHLATTNSNAKYLLDIYESTVNTNGSKLLSDSDVIVSFVNKIHHKAPHLRHDRNRRLYFDMTESPDDVVSAELRIFREATHKKKEHKCENADHVLELHAVGSEENMLELIDSMELPCDKTGLLLFNVTGPMLYWLAFPEKNNGLFLKLRSSESSNVDLHDVGIVGSKGPEEKQPFLVAFFKNFKMPSQGVHIRKTRAARAKKKQQESYYDPWNPYSASFQDMYPARHSCQKLMLYVSFKDLGWQDWIIAPSGFAAYYCSGICSFPLNVHMNATNHAIVQTLVHLMDPGLVPKPCCVPSALAAITVLYFDDNSNVILKRYKNMIVKACGCH